MAAEKQKTRVAMGARAFYGLRKNVIAKAAHAAAAERSKSPVGRYTVYCARTDSAAYTVAIKDTAAHSPARSRQINSIITGFPYLLQYNYGNITEYYTKRMGENQYDEKKLTEKGEKFLYKHCICEVYGI